MSCKPKQEVIRLDLKEAYGKYSDAITAAGLSVTMLGYVGARILSATQDKSNILDTVGSVGASIGFALAYINVFLDEHVKEKLGELTISLDYECEKFRAVRQGIVYEWEALQLADINIQYN